MVDILGVVSGVASIFGAMPTTLQLFIVSALFLVDASFLDFTSLIAGVFLGWLGLEVGAFFFFVLFFVAGLISAMFMSNRWFGSG